MNTITAKELRDNLGDIAKRVHAGEHIVVSYRNLYSFTLTPTEPAHPNRKPLSGLEAFLKAPKKPSPYDPNKSIKEIYHELLEEKHGGR